MGRMFRTIMLGDGSEVQRNEILETLLRKIAELEEENAMLRLNLAETIHTRNEYMADADHGAVEISQLRGDVMTLLAKMSIEKPQRPIQENEVFLNNTPFVVVLIDGSASMLETQHVQRGEKGGRKAIKKFHDHLMQYLIGRQVFQIHWRLIIKFYASMSGLGTSYLKSNTVNDLETWRGFINGFNDEYPLCYFIDSGDGDINAQHKMQNELALFFGHHDCQHTVLIESPNGSYAGFIRQYVKSDELCGRITFIEAIPFPGEIHDLSSRFLPAHKDSLFATSIDSCIPIASPIRMIKSPSQTNPVSVSLDGNLVPYPGTVPGSKRSETLRPRTSSFQSRSILNNAPTLASGPDTERSIKSHIRANVGRPSSSLYPMSSPTPTLRRSIRPPIGDTSLIPSSSLNPFPSPSPSSAAKARSNSAAFHLQPPPTPTPSKQDPKIFNSSTSSSSLQVPSPTSISPTRSKPRSRSSLSTPLKDASPSHSPLSGTTKLAKSV